MAGDPLGRGARPGFGGRSGHVREAGLPSELVRDVLVATRGRPTRRRLRELIRLLIACCPAVCGDPANGHLVVPGENPDTDLHCRDGKTLAWAQGVGPHSVDGGGQVDEGRIVVAALLTLVHDAERLVDGENLSVEDLLVRAKVETAAGLAAR